uniref:Homeobox domain-containing protein n=1 Tax=Oryza brachyantha TaxID=4533 RepID=J3M9R8_ORYBR
MFRSNLACNIRQLQQQPDMNGNGSGGGGGSSSPSLFLSPSPPVATSGKPSLISSGCEEGTRNPEPKPRWNPRPEQIRILEGIFNSGMVNPPRDEIRRIRLQLQEYGQLTSPESTSLLLQWPPGQYMPATELGGVLGSHGHNPAVTHHQPSISPGVLLAGLCNEALGQEIMDDMSCSKQGFGHYMDMSCTELSSKTDAVSTVIRDDEKARLGLLPYGVGVTASATDPAPRHHHHHHHHHLASPVHAAVAAADAPFTTTAAATPSSNVVASNSALADQLQGNETRLGYVKSPVHAPILSCYMHMLAVDAKRDISMTEG